MKIEIIPATREHIPLVLATCRGREREQLMRLGARASDYVRQVIESSSEAWSGFIDDELACMWGVDHGTLIGNSARIWLAGTAAINEHPFAFVRHSQIRLAELRKRFHYIYGVVEVDNEQSMRWLRWLGFTLSPTEYVNGYALKKFSMVI